ncbi:MAG: FeoB-associated Cys-rich membrane protein [Planctomycetaceae bacterium]|nr:FeoB-associated Cys-rich membrane protein [Planctomycetaceae bacterium]
MVETIIVAAIVLVAVIWFVRWFKGATSGERGCGCGGCGKNCAGRKEPFGSGEK